MVRPSVDPCIDQRCIDGVQCTFDVVAGHVLQTEPAVFPGRRSGVCLIATGNIASDESGRATVGVTVAQRGRPDLLESFLRLDRRERVHGDPSASDSSS